VIKTPTFLRGQLWRWALILGIVAFISGCATQSAPPANPLVGMQTASVRFLHGPPPNAKFIAKIVYSSEEYDNWQSNCIQYLAAKAVKLGGNVVVPGVELDFGPHRFYNDQLNGPPPNTMVVHELHGRDAYGYPQAETTVVLPTRFHFWSNIYYCPE
jgi:hypothetical protein